MLVSREEFVASLTYMEITNEEMLMFIHESIENLGPIDLWKNYYDDVLAVHNPENKLFAIQRQSGANLSEIIHSGNHLAISLETLLGPMRH